MQYSEDALARADYELDQLKDEKLNRDEREAILIEWALKSGRCVYCNRSAELDRWGTCAACYE